MVCKLDAILNGNSDLKNAGKKKKNAEESHLENNGFGLSFST